MKKYMLGLLLGLVGCVGAETMSTPSSSSDSDEIVLDDEFEAASPAANRSWCLPYTEILSVPFSDNKIIVLIASNCDVPLWEDFGYPPPDSLEQDIFEERY